MEKDLTSLEVVLTEVLEELSRAQKKFPEWPSDPLHAHAILNEECGELGREILQLTYEPEKSDLHHVEQEAVQTGAMAIRFLLSLEKYNFSGSKQHKQNEV